MPAIIYKNKEGNRVPSVTTILAKWGANKNSLMYWAWREGKEGRELYEKKAADIGTLAHLMIEDDIKGTNEVKLEKFPVDIVEPAKQAFENFLTWKKQTDFKPIETEVSLVSEAHQFGGTIDCVATVSGKLTIVDWKTGADIYEDNIVQLAAYEKLWEENFPTNQTDGFHILRTGKEMAMFAHQYYKDFSLAFDAFLNLRELYELEKKIKKLK